MSGSPTPVKNLTDFRKQLDSLSESLSYFKPEERDKAIKILQECIKDCTNNLSLEEVLVEPGATTISNIEQNNEELCLISRTDTSNVEENVPLTGFYLKESNIEQIHLELLKHPEYCIQNNLEEKSSVANTEDEVTEDNFPSEESDFISEEEWKTSLQCPKCKEKYDDKHKLLEHLKTYNGKNKSCDGCFKTFSNSLAFRYHKQLGMCVRAGKMFKCKLCNRVLCGESQYNKHVDAHKRNQCSTCGDHFSRQKHLEAHLVNVHNGAINKELFRCHICNRQFTQRRSLVYHFKLAHPGNGVMCEVCLDMFSCSEDLEPHLATHKLTTFSCDKCGQTFSRRQQYQLHVKEHEKYKCKVCSEGFSSKKTAEAHAQSGHEVQGLEPQQQCAECGQMFLTRSQLNNHVLEHTGGKSHYCEQCKVSFKRFTNYKNHLESYEHLRGEAPKHLLACQECGKTFPNKNNLRVHVSRVHKARKEHSCPHCSYKTKLLNNLKRHIASHTDKPQFVCDKCGGQFQTKASLQEHHLRLHSNSKDFSCDKCGTMFSRSSDLNRHIVNKHSDVPLYSCHCGNSYRTRSNLKRHQLLGHREVDKPMLKLFASDGTVSTKKGKKNKQESTATISTDAEDLQLLNSQIQEVSSVITESNTVVVMADSHSQELLQVSYSMDFTQDKSQVVYTQSLDMSGMQVVDSMIHLENDPSKQSSNVLMVRNLFDRNDYILQTPIESSMVNNLENSLVSEAPDIDMSSQKQNVITDLQEYIIPNELNFLNV